MARKALILATAAIVAAFAALALFDICAWLADRAMRAWWL